MIRSCCCTPCSLDPSTARSRGRFRYLVDIGANIGSVTLDLAWRDPNLKVDAYEPNPLTFDTLTRNVRENGLESRVRTFRDAVTSQNGEVLLWSGESSVLSSVSASADDRRRVGLRADHFTRSRDHTHRQRAGGGQDRRRGC